MAVFTPIPSAVVAITTIQKEGLRRRCRQECNRFCPRTSRSTIILLVKQRLDRFLMPGKLEVRRRGEQLPKAWRLRAEKWPDQCQRFLARHVAARAQE